MNIAKMKINEDNKLRYCKKCRKKTLHLKCGFGEYGGLVGNARYRCLECNSEGL